MKKTLLTIATTITAMTLSAQNPLLSAWNTTHATPPFSQIEPAHFSEATPILIGKARAQMDVIINNTDAPTFENTIVAMELSGDELTRALSVFGNLMGSNTNPELQKIAMELSPLLTAYSNDISLNPKLFARVKAVYDSRDKLNLTTEQGRLLEKTYKGFTRSGANLKGEDKDKYRAISEELSTLSLQFDENELAATNAFTVEITDAADLKGMPQWAVDAAGEAAVEAGKTGYLITLHAPSYIPVMTYCDNRELREKLWRAYNSRAFGGPNDNQPIVKRTAELRLELAKLLGYKTYADYVLEERMAGSVDAVQKLLKELLDNSIEAAKKDVKEIWEYATKQGFQGQLMNWDFGYWSEKLKQDKYAISDDMTRPYFKLENVQEALFMLAGKLYGLTFTPNDDIETCHSDAHAFEVFDREGKFLSVLYLDYFPRASKNSGAWMSSYRDMYVDGKGAEVRPIVTLVCNFTKPTADRPSLLSFDEFTTVLHEFGHGLHGMLAKGNYASLTGTAVYRDFVELPSQIMENWALEKEFLDMFAVHYQSGEKIPQELIDKLVAAKNYNAAYSNVRQLSFGIGDMAWHSITAPILESVEQFEKNATKKAQVMPTPDGTCMATAFGHIFSGGYAAGYYSYKWAEVLEADAFNQFKKGGIFNPKTAAKFLDLLQAGGTEHPMTLYVRFAGAEPTIEPLLEKMGLTPLSDK